MLRCDLLTGTVAVEVQQPGKPIPPVVRALPEGPAACPLCGIAERRLTGVDPGVGGEVPRGEVGPPGRAFAVDNRWKLLDAPPTGTSSPPVGRGEEVDGAGTVELVLTPRHATSLDGLPRDDARALVTLLLLRQQALAAEYGEALAFLSVGVQAGSSLPHLHGQVAGFSWSPPSGEPVDAACPVCGDADRAREVGRVVVDGPLHLTYVPWGPATSGELRVALPYDHRDPAARQSEPRQSDWDARNLGQRFADGLVDALGRLEACGLHWPYQVVLHPDLHPHAHLLPRLDLGMIYPRFVGVMPVTFDHTEYARRLAAATPVGPPP